MADQQAARRFRIVHTHESQATIEELIEQLTRLNDERLRLVEKGGRLRKQILRLVEHQKKRDEESFDLRYAQLIIALDEILGAKAGEE